MDISTLPAVMGSLLIIAGIAQVFCQMLGIPRTLARRQSQSVNFDKSGFKVETAYPGMGMICVGALLLSIGAFTR